MNNTTKRIIISIIFVVVIQTEYIIFNSMNKAMQHNGYQNRPVFLFVSALIIAASFAGLSLYWSAILKEKSKPFYILLRFVIPILCAVVVLLFCLNIFFHFLPI